VDARAGSTRATGSASGPPLEPGIESEVEVASVVADMAWLWDDPACLPVTRRQLLHVRLAGGDSVLAERLEAVLARHPGTDEVVLHVVVGSREVTVHAYRDQVLSSPAGPPRDLYTAACYFRAIPCFCIQVGWTRQGAGLVIGSLAASHASKPPMTSVALTSPRSRSEAAARLLE